MLRAITQHSLGNRAGDLGNRAGDLGNRAGDLGPLGGQSNRRQGSLTRYLPSTWQIAALYAFLAIHRNDSGNLF